jgi:hypothetical protein
MPSSRDFIIAAAMFSGWPRMGSGTNAVRARTLATCSVAMNSSSHFPMRSNWADGAADLAGSVWRTKPDGVARNDDSGRASSVMRGSPHRRCGRWWDWVAGRDGGADEVAGVVDDVRIAAAMRNDLNCSGPEYGDELRAIGVDEDRAAAVDFHHGKFLADRVEVELGVAVGGELQCGLAEDALLVGLEVQEQRLALAGRVGDLGDQVEGSGVAVSVVDDGRFDEDRRRRRTCRGTGVGFDVAAQLVGMPVTFSPLTSVSA